MSHRPTMSPGGWCYNVRHPSRRPSAGTTPSTQGGGLEVGIQDPLRYWGWERGKVPSLSAFSSILIPAMLHHSPVLGAMVGTPSASLFPGHALSLLPTLMPWLLTADRYALGVFTLCLSWGPGLLARLSPSASLSLGPCSGTSGRS